MYKSNFKKLKKCNNKKCYFYVFFIVTPPLLINLLINQINSDKIHYRPLPLAVENELNIIAEKTVRSFSSTRFSQRNLKIKFEDVYLIDEKQKEYFLQARPTETVYIA